MESSSLKFLIRHFKPNDKVETIELRWIDKYYFRIKRQIKELVLKWGCFQYHIYWSSRSSLRVDMRFFYSPYCDCFCFLYGLIVFVWRCIKAYNVITRGILGKLRKSQIMTAGWDNLLAPLRISISEIYTLRHFNRRFLWYRGGKREKAVRDCPDMNPPRRERILHPNSRETELRSPVTLWIQEKCRINTQLRRVPDDSAVGRSSILFYRYECHKSRF